MIYTFYTSQGPDMLHGITAFHIPKKENSVHTWIVSCYYICWVNVKRLGIYSLNIHRNYSAVLQMENCTISVLDFFWHGPHICQINIKTESVSIRMTISCKLHRLFQHLPVKSNGGSASFCNIKSRQS